MGADKEVFELLKPAKANNYVLLNFLDRQSVPEDGVSAFDSLQPPMIFAGATPLAELLATNEGTVEFVREPTNAHLVKWVARILLTNSENLGSMSSLGNLQDLYCSGWMDFIFGSVWFDVLVQREVYFTSNASLTRDEKTIGRTQA